MSDIDGFLMPVTAVNKQAYREMPFDGKRMVYGGFEPLLDV